VSLLNKIFWAVVAVEALFFVIAFVLTANESGHSDGGKEMSLGFQIGVPFLILGVACLIYWKTHSPALHVVLLLLVSVPLVLLAAHWMRTSAVESDAEAGGWVFEDPSLKQFLAAVSNLDEKKVREMALRVDVNAAGESGWTPLKWAVKNVVDAGNKMQPTAPGIAMVRLLLSLGAKPDPALSNACASNHGEVTGILLDAGANPNYKEEDGTPAFFSCLKWARSGELESLRLLAAKGADFNALDPKGEGALLMAAIFSKWDSALFLLEQGVKDAPAPDGKTALAQVTKAMENQLQVPANLQQLAAKLRN
jgi:hypothetical protein